ncbi:helix-turn-helix transcriptional regulator [Streptomyces sp. 2P-4]|uniref:helix-turn-helix transcriptional regulator n=1 Tax=Streptomyces sp. 2P-4 TaxID=2931974 RepID=UPI0025404A8D|nr:helix-turn-helix transcriptional regulator [Streptomyces sp. 2P-4]
MSSEWAQLGKSLKAARIELGMEQQDVAAAIGVKRGALHNIERGAIARVTHTVRAYADLVGWTDDSISDVLAGGTPTLKPPEEPAPPAPAADPLPAGLSTLVQEALREGPLLGSRVEEVVTPSGRVRATIVIRGEEGTPPEELLAALRSLRIEVTVDD